MLRTKRAGNIASGVCLALLGLAAAWASTDIGEGAGGQLHPRTFPLLIGVLLVIGGGVLGIRSLVARTSGRKPIDWPTPSGWKFWLVALAALVLLVALSVPFGFLVTSSFFVFGFIWYFGRYHPALAAVWALGVSAFVYLVFVRLLDLALPLGPLSFLG